MSTTNADAQLLIEAYYKIVDKINEASASFLDAAPDDPDRQISLQSKLMAAVVARFVTSMPSLTDNDVLYIVNFALNGVREFTAELARSSPDRDLN